MCEHEMSVSGHLRAEGQRARPSCRWWTVQVRDADGFGCGVADGYLWTSNSSFKI
ncbi:hypothetical protein CPB84DRAFT_1774972 [Gymnopilus junonius]|uniref:Uncharacterized protein n=1 Tax=Gymnopilus junonius TaxID=109634 RepID=A0A9P5NTC1_GYMJU|nr:hypothetical protein CPB84DRAFT_1774972 [Gymnopilus junonius]